MMANHYKTTISPGLMTAYHVSLFRVWQKAIERNIVSELRSHSAMRSRACVRPDRDPPARIFGRGSNQHVRDVYRHPGRTPGTYGLCRFPA
jgi:hypothetical protein